MRSLQPVMGSLLFAGTIVGAGILGLPYALAQSGFIGGIFLLLLGGFFAYLTATYIAILVYQQTAQFPLHIIVEKYLGKNMSYLTLAAIIFTSYGALVAYPLAIGAIFSSVFSLPNWIGMNIFLILMLLLVSRSLGSSNKVNAAITLLLGLILLWVMIRAIPFLHVQNYLYFNPSLLLSGWGVIIFAFAGHMVIPTVIYYIQAEQKKGLRILLYGILGVGFLYLLFFVVSIGVMGVKTTPVATNGLGLFLTPTVAMAGQIFAVLAIITSFFGIAISLRQTYEAKANMPMYLSLVAIFGPVIILDLILNAGGGQAFVRVLNYAGGIGSSLFAGLIPALIVLQVRNAYRFPFGMGGAYACVVFYGLAILYTLFT